MATSANRIASELARAITLFIEERVKGDAISTARSLRLAVLFPFSLTELPFKIPKQPLKSGIARTAR
jgi:hypothetical protein